MNPVKALQARSGWTPSCQMVSQKPAPQGYELFKVPVSSGKQGWLVFTYDKDIPVGYFISGHECQKLNGIVIDARICGDTVMRVEKLDDKYLVADIFLYNSNCVFACSSFKQRYDWSANLVKTFCGPQIVHKSDYDFKCVYHEVYTDTEGFREEIGEVVRVKQLSTPDCYEVVEGGYLSVPSMALSAHLRTLGEEFSLRCSKGEDDFWIILENIPCVK